MEKDTGGKKRDCGATPARKRSSVTYATLKESEVQAVALERMRFKFSEIVPTRLPKPNLAP